MANNANVSSAAMLFATSQGDGIEHNGYSTAERISFRNLFIAVATAPYPYLDPVLAVRILDKRRVSGAEIHRNYEDV